jgi:hypothetical protein
LGDPWTDRCFGACDFELGLLCLHEADNPPGGADGPRGAQLLGVLSRLLPSLLFDPLIPVVLVARGSADSREESVDGLPGADVPRVLSGWSVFSGALLEVREPISDSLPRACGRSAWPPRTVCPLHADGPLRPL